ncbi:MAG: hypothetical protein IH923_05850 [Nitrospinae bacterium]|nr:hypothetical protein [Nitrospinota bacterium]
MGTGHYLALRFMFADNGNGSIDIARVQVEKGTVANEFERRPIGLKRALAERYFRILGKGMTGGWHGSTLAGFGVVLQPPMRAACSLSLNDTTPIIEEVGVADRTGTASIVSASSISADGMWFRINGFTGATAGNPAISKEDAILTCDAEL